MEKFLNLKKSCFVSEKIEFFDVQEVEDFLRILLSRGFFHFYLKKEMLGKPFLKVLQNYQKKRGDILIFFVYGHKNRLWRYEGVTNLAVFQADKEEPCVDAWLRRYCDKFVEKKKFDANI